MLRVRTTVGSEDKVPAQNEKTAKEAADSMGEILEMLASILEKNTNLMKKMDRTNNHISLLQALEQRHRPGMAGVQKEETSW